MASDTTTASFIFKRKYADKKPGELAMRFHPTLQLIKKVGGFVGHDPNGTFYYALKYANPQGVSASFSTAQSISSSGGASSGVQMGASRVEKYGVIQIAGPALLASRGNDGAFVSLVSQESESIMDEMGDTLAFELHRDGTGVRGQRASISTNTVTLGSAADVRNFKPGMYVEAGPNSDGSSLRSGNTYVTAVDRAAGTITLNSAAAISSFADNDYLFRQGDSGSGNTVDGFEQHLPLSTPGSFRGADRTKDTENLGGVRVDDTATSIEENAGLVAVKIGQLGKKATHLILNPIKFWEVCRRLNAKVEYSGGGGVAGYGFESFKIHTPAGTLTCVSDPDAPEDRGRVLDLSCWEWKYMGAPWIHPITDDKGGMFLRVYNSDAIEGRIRTSGNTICYKPGANGTFSI